MSDDRVSRESRWSGFVRTASSWPNPIIVGLLPGLVAAVGWVDFLIGVELSVSPPYLVPITIGTWVAVRSIGKPVAIGELRKTMEEHIRH